MWVAVVICVGSWWTCLGQHDYPSVSHPATEEACLEWGERLAKDFHVGRDYPTGYYCFFDDYQPPRVKRP